MIILKASSRFDNKVFYERIISRFEASFQRLTNNESEFVIDMQDVEFISPSVLPKICSFCLLAKQKGLNPTIWLSHFSGIKNYLDNLNFFNIVDKYEIACIDSSFLGGINTGINRANGFFCFEKSALFDKYTKKYTFNESLKEKEILDICITFEIFGEPSPLQRIDEIDDDRIKKSPVLTVLSHLLSTRRHEGDSNVKMPENKNDYYIKLKEMGMVFCELVQNSLWYGSEICLFSIQIGHFSKFDKVDISISDVGNGLYKTLVEKDWKTLKKAPYSMELNEFLELKDPKEQDIYSIVETILFRRNDLIRGVYHIISDLRDKKDPEISFQNRALHASFGDSQINNLENWNPRINIDAILPLSKRLHLNNDYGFSVDISFKL